MSFGKDAFRDEDEKGATRSKPFSKDLRFKPTIPADDWIGTPFNGRKNYSQKVIEDYGQLVIKDYVLFQVTTKDYCNALSHRWDGQTLERLVARVYSDRNGIIPVFETSENGMVERNFVERDMPLVGFATNFKCREKLTNFSWNTKGVRNVVTCDITLFKPIDTPFFNSAVIGSIEYHSYVDGDSCVLKFITTANDVGTPCYMPASMTNLQKKIKEQAHKIEDLEKKSCKSNDQKSCCCDARSSTDCICENDCYEDDCSEDVCEAPDCSDEAWRDGN